MEQIIVEKSKQYFETVVAIRRELHQHPELSFCEKNTAELIKRYLASKILIINLISLDMA